MEDRKVLVVDDSKTMIRIITNTLIRSGISSENITTALDGTLAVDELKEKGFEYFDIILSDINMPNMNGYQLIEYIRRRNKDVPIVTISTEGGKGEIVRALRLGSTNYIVKPFTPQVLREKLEQILNKEY